MPLPSAGRGLFKELGPWVFAGAATYATLGCNPVVLVTPYDEVTDTRLQDYKEALNTFVNRAASDKETAKGTFEASKDDYTALEAKITGIIDRAAMLDQGVPCKLDANTWGSIKAKLTKAAGLPVSNTAAAGDGSGCILSMLKNVSENLDNIKKLHQDPRYCASQNPEFPTCLRTATAADALTISNQTIDAVTFIESVLKKHQGSS